MKLNIRRKIILISLGIFSLAIGINTAVNGIYFTTEYSDALHSEVFVISRTLKSQLVRLLKMHIPIDQLVGFEEICQDLLIEHKYISYAMVVAPDGVILFHNDPTRHDQKISDPLILKGIGNVKELVQVTTINGENYYDFYIPVFGWQREHIATVRTGFPVDVITKKTRKMIIFSTIITAISFTIGILVLAMLLNLWVGKPLHRFVDTIQDIRNNWTDTEKHIEITSNDEIGQLALAFNQMRDDLLATTVSKDYLDNIIGNMLNSLIIINSQRKIITVNQATLDLLGYEEHEIVGKVLDKVFVKLKEFIEKNGKDQEVLSSMNAVEVVYLSKNGKEIPVLFSSSKMLNKDKDTQGFICVAHDITDRKKIEEQREELIKRLQDALKEIKELRGFLPICSNCKKIRDDEGYWQQMEKYITERTNAQFSHGICPDCMRKLYPDMADQVLDEYSKLSKFAVPKNSLRVKK